MGGDGVGESDAAGALDDPVLGGPYDPPARYFEIGPTGPTGRIIDGRRPSESFIPVPPVRKKRARQQAAEQQLELHLRTDEQVQTNDVINELRIDVARWRTAGYEHATAISRKLLTFWADPLRDNRILFAQREAAETAIFLAEAAGRAGYRRWRDRLDAANTEYNDGLPRVALKMATGAGKTIVMGMLITWQTLNKIASPTDRRYVKRFLVVTPGITIRDRLRVLKPNDERNVYRERGLVPADLSGLLGKAQVQVTNWHTFLPREAKELKGVSATTKKILTQGRADDPFVESEEAMVSRVLRGWGVGTGGQGRARQTEILVFNDEAHHCYQDRPLTVDDEFDGAVAADRDDKRRNADARIWFTGLAAVAKRVGVKQVYDLSATPFFLSGSGYKEGFIFPWTVSDFSLMDAIESGIVKVPRIPVDDDAATDTVTYLNLWDLVGKDLPKTNVKNIDVTNWVPPIALEGALTSLYRSYQRSFEHWRAHLEAVGEPPPVFIVVCPNTAVSKLVYDWIAGAAIETVDGTARLVPGNLPLFANAADGRAVDRPRTILIDSAQLESGEALSKEFKVAAAGEIDAFKAAWRRRNPGGDAEALTDADVLREVMNTVGKPDSLGSEVRCVVSVAMLTEGWDANTVTHILGIRAFGSQLLCEQVIGRGLRRRVYAVNDDGRFDAEYASIYGVPFSFLPSQAPKGDPKPPTPTVEVRTVPGRQQARIRFPHLSGYRLEIPDEELYLPDGLERFVIGQDLVPTWTQSASVVGGEETDHDDDPELRTQTVAYELAKRLVAQHYAETKDAAGQVRVEPRPWLFPTLARLCRQWLETAVRVEKGIQIGHLVKYTMWQAKAADAIYRAITRVPGDRRPRMRPILRAFDPVGDTGSVSFSTRKVALPTDAARCEISHVVLDGPGGNTWEQLAMAFCEADPRIAAYAKNDHIGFTIPYVFEGRSHEYLPDFLIRLRRRGGDPVDRHLIVEISGGRKTAHSPGSTAMKAAVARDSWCPAVNNHGGFGRWGYIEITDIPRIAADLGEAIENLYADKPIIGTADLLDFDTDHDGRGAHAAAR